MASGWTCAHTYIHTHTHTHFGGMKVISRNQAHAGLWLAHTWFKNILKQKKDDSVQDLEPKSSAKISPGIS